MHTFQDRKSVNTVVDFSVMMNVSSDQRASEAGCAGAAISNQMMTGLNSVRLRYYLTHGYINNLINQTVDA